MTANQPLADRRLNAATDRRPTDRPPTVDQPQPDQTRFRDLQEFCETAAAYPLESDPGSAYVYGINQGAKAYETTTTDATPATLATLATLTTDGDAYRIRVEAQAKTDAAGGGEVLDAEIGGLYYRTGGAVLVLNPTATVSRVGLTTAAPALVVVGDNVTLTATGELATNIKWTARAVEVREIPSP